MIISICNQKGGVGKSTTAHALGAGLILKGCSVLYIDLDAQGNLTYSMGSAPSDLSAYDLITRRETAANVIQHTAQGDLIPASPVLSASDAAITATGKEYRLREALEPVKTLYDYIVIDCPPALGTLTVNALTASDAVITPSQSDVFSLQGIAQLSETVGGVQTYCNPGLKWAGILLTRHSGRSVLTREMTSMMEDAAEQLGTIVYNTRIREAVALREAQAMRQSIFTYAPRSKAAADYAAFVDEYIERSKRS